MSRKLCGLVPAAVDQIRNKITLPSLCTYFNDVNGKVIYTDDKLEIAEVGTYTVVWNQDELAYQLADDEGKIQLSLLAVIYTVGPKAITLVEADPLKPAKSSSSSEVDN